MLGNRLLLRWKEPRYGLKYIKKQLPWSFWLRQHLVLGAKWGLALFALIVIAAFYNRSINLFYHDAFPVTAFGFGVGFIISFLSWLTTTSDVEIRLREKDIARIGADASFTINFKNIKECQIRDAELENLKFELLIIKLWDGQESVLELAPTVSGEQVLQVFQGRNVQVNFLKQQIFQQNILT